MHQLFSLFSKLKGWKHIGQVPDNIPKCILIGAPHTSNWDFIHGVGALGQVNRKPKFLIKKESFVFPLSILLKSLGGIPVDRKKTGGMVDAMVDMINQHDRIMVLMTPEGTRSYVKNWKTGFYRVALKANIPIYLGSIDFGKKETRIGEEFIPSGDIEADMKRIKQYYLQFEAKYPELGVREEDI